MIFIVLAIIILVISFILALISLIREQKAISTPTHNEGESAKSGEGRGVAPDSAVSSLEVAAFDFGDETHLPVGETGQSTQISTLAPRKAFFWEGQSNKQQVDAGQTETQSTARSGTQELWRNKQEIQIESKQSLSGEISLREITQKDQK